MLKNEIKLQQKHFLNTSEVSSFNLENAINIQVSGIEQPDLNYLLRKSLCKKLIAEIIETVSKCFIHGYP